MINLFILNKLIEEYIDDILLKSWDKINKKWKALKVFNDTWDINSTNFYRMFKKATQDIRFVFESNGYHPIADMQYFAGKYNSDLKTIYASLYDEDIDINKRLDGFIQQCNYIYKSSKNINIDKCIQNKYTASIYLWLRYPEKYYIYNFVEINYLAEILYLDDDSKHMLHEKYENILLFYNKINEIIRNNERIKNIYPYKITDECYQDIDFKVLTHDICFYISHNFNRRRNISCAKWEDILNNEDIISDKDASLLFKIENLKKDTTYYELYEFYGENPEYYRSYCEEIGKKVINYFNLKPFFTRDGSLQWAPILFTDYDIDENSINNTKLKLKPDLIIAMHEMHSILKFKVENLNIETTKYWILSINSKIINFIDIQNGEEIEITCNKYKENELNIFKNIKINDIVICCEAGMRSKIVALGYVNGKKNNLNFSLKKQEGLIYPIDLQMLCVYECLKKLNIYDMAYNRIMELTLEQYKSIIKIIRFNNIEIPNKQCEQYTKNNFLNEVFIDEVQYNNIMFVLEKKKNIILQGAPGVGKTFIAKRLAWSLIEEKNDNYIEFVQFHQNYSYEDFIIGYRPKNNNFELTYGAFYQFCIKAKNQKSKKFIFIIDEINRGNLSKIFGELMVLIEDRYRNTSISLANNGIRFSVPSNLYIIGIMNTADRSLSVVDYALRRRFSFIDIYPGFDTQGFKNHQKNINNKKFDKLIEVVKELNQDILEDDALGKGFCIGHSYFCKNEKNIDLWIYSIVNYEIIPLLHEYWFDDDQRVRHWESILQGIIK